MLEEVFQRFGRPIWEIQWYVKSEIEMNTTKISTQGENDDKYHKSCENVEKQIENYRCRKYNAKLKYGSVCCTYC